MDILPASSSEMAQQTAVSPKTPILAVQLSSEMQTLFNTAVRDNLPIMALAVALFHGVLAVVSFYFLPQPISQSLTSLSIAISIFLFALYVALRRWTLPHRIQFAHPAAAGIAALAAFNAFAYLYLTGDPRQTTILVFTTVGVGFFFLSYSWLTAAFATIIIGWLAIAWQHAFSSEWIFFGFALATAVGLGLVLFIVRRRSLLRYENLRVQDEKRQFELRLRARQLETLVHTGEVLTGTLKWDDVLGMILDQVGQILSYDRASVLVRDRNFLELVAFKGFPLESRPSKIRISLDNETVYQQICTTKRPLAITDVAHLEDWQQVENLPSARSWLGVPLVHVGEVVGMLSLTRETVHPYNEADITLAMGFAVQAAIALENARRFDETHRFNQQMEYEVRQRTRAIQDAYEQLEKLDKNKSEFITVVSHELRTPLTIMRGYNQMLLRDPDIQANEMHYSLVSGIQAGTGRMHDIINNMLEVAKIDNKSLKLVTESVDLCALISKVCHQFVQDLADRNLTINSDLLCNLPPVEADPDAMEKVFYHLIMNAIKYTPDGGTISIIGKLFETETENVDLPGEGVEIIVQDTGIGIDPDLQDLIFTKFYQTGEVALHSSAKTTFKGGGPGLGLAISKGIVEAHQGKIWAESPGHDEGENPGSAFHVVLPKLQPRLRGQQPVA